MDKGGSGGAEAELGGKGCEEKGASEMEGGWRGSDCGKAVA